MVSMVDCLILTKTLVPVVKTSPRGEGAAAAAASRKRLMISTAEKEKLLDWDTVVASEEALEQREQVEFIVQQFRWRNKSPSSSSTSPSPSLFPSSPFYL